MLPETFQCIEIAADGAKRSFVWAYFKSLYILNHNLLICLCCTSFKTRFYFYCFKLVLFSCFGFALVMCGVNWEQVEGSLERYENDESQSKEDRILIWNDGREMVDIQKIQKLLIMELPVKTKRGRWQRRLIDAVEKDLQRVGVTEQDARIQWDGGRMTPKVKKRRSCFVKHFGFHLCLKSAV